MRALAVLSLSLFLTGCALGPSASPNPQPGLSISGNIRGGNQPIVGAHVYLFAANTTGYGQPSVSLLNSSSTGLSDSLGAYVLSDSGGGFTITGDYTCTSGQQVYLYALGGNPGAGINTAASLMAVLGSCPASGNFLTASPFIIVNEVTTISAAYALSGFATDATHVSSSGTPQAQTGIANAFTNAANIANIATGTALTTTPAGNGAVPQTEINTLANILAACVNSTGAGSTSCSTLFSNAQSGGSTGTTPIETATAAINIAHNPGSNVASLFALQAAAAPFVPMLSSAPNNLTLILTFSVTPTISTTKRIAIDGSGNVWTLATTPTSSSLVITKLSSSGTVLSGSTGYPIPSDAGALASGALAIDQYGNAWLAGNGNVYRVSGSGTVSTFHPDESGFYANVAMDASGNVWLNTSSTTPTLVELSASGTDLHFTAAGPAGGTGLALSYSGIVWTSTYSNALYGTSIATGNNLNVTESDLSSPDAVALDSSGSIWVMQGCCSTTLTEFSYNASTNAYDPIPLPGFSDLRPSGIAVDGANNVWLAADYAQPALVSFSNSGGGVRENAFYPFSGFPSGIGLDSSGNAWLASISNIVEFVGISTPVVTPLSVAVKNNTVATRP